MHVRAHTMHDEQLRLGVRKQDALSRHRLCANSIDVGKDVVNDVTL